MAAFKEINTYNLSILFKQRELNTLMQSVSANAAWAASVDPLVRIRARAVAIVIQHAARSNRTPIHRIATSVIKVATVETSVKVRMLKLRVINEYIQNN